MLGAYGLLLHRLESLLILLGGAMFSLSEICSVCCRTEAIRAGDFTYVLSGGGSGAGDGGGGPNAFTMIAPSGVRNNEQPQKVD